MDPIVMVRKMSPEDFRAVRMILDPDDFAISSGESDPPPSDLITENCWQNIVTLPDDVSIRTSDRFGTLIENLSGYASEFICVTLAMQELSANVPGSPMCHVTLDAYDEFQASIYNAITGFYRLAFSALRNVLENMTIGLWLELSGDTAKFADWLSGAEQLSFGKAADFLMGSSTVKPLEDHLQATLADDLFRQRVAGTGGGFARRLFGKLSAFTHGGPGFNDGGLRNSNGPIFVPTAFRDWGKSVITVLSISLILCKLAQPKLNNLGNCSELTLPKFFDEITGLLDHSDDGEVLFRNVPPMFWS